MLAYGTTWVNAMDPGSVFEDNDTDIDNRCGREVNISQTTFR